MLRVRARGVTLLGLLLLVAGPASGQEEHEHDQELQVPLVEELPVADGRLDEEVWGLAAVADGFIQTEPVDGAEPTYATEVYVAYTPDALLVGARMEDDDPAAIVAREYRRDANLESDDNFFIVLDTYHDHRSAVFFSTNAVGTRQDGLVQNEGAAINNEWDGVWRVGSRRTEDGWTTEMVIPFETLRFPRGTRNFGVNFGRQVARTREISFWAPISVDWGFNAMWRVSAYGVMHGMEHANPGG
ncbi:MAG: carbohydrate binding family 9 domain-containing protein, partial [Acidobacteriota bacterium]|nr:carbohydrate binding family 9 domain-containing protein [Acidobacteriota bacterium]